MTLTCGVDEAGRGPGAGPVVAAAVILPDGFTADGLTDSKKVTEKRREALFAQINEQAMVGVGIAEPEEIDRLNILHATMAAMARAVIALPQRPHMAHVDGNKVPPGLPCDARALVGGDASHAHISAASIIAKVTRDHLMQIAHARYPQYGFAGHKGYLTKEHKQALADHGPCPLHRLSFAPIRAAWAQYQLI